MSRSVAAIVIREGRVLLAQRGFSGPLAKLWEFPGGKVETGESDAEALVREFTEEFGVPVRPLRLLGESSFLHKGRNRPLVAWLAELPEGDRLNLIEHAGIAWVDAAELPGHDLVESDRGLLPFVLPLLERA